MALVHFVLTEKTLNSVPVFVSSEITVILRPNKQASTCSTAKKKKKKSTVTFLKFVDMALIITKIKLCLDDKTDQKHEESASGLERVRN